MFIWLGVNFIKFINEKFVYFSIDDKFKMWTFSPAISTTSETLPIKQCNLLRLGQNIIERLSSGFLANVQVQSLTWQTVDTVIALRVGVYLSVCGIVISMPTSGGEAEVLAPRPHTTLDLRSHQSLRHAGFLCIYALSKTF